jgi:hypothetical protein
VTEFGHPSHVAPDLDFIIPSTRKSHVYFGHKKSHFPMQEKLGGRLFRRLRVTKAEVR